MTLVCGYKLEKLQNFEITLAQALAWLWPTNKDQVPHLVNTISKHRGLVETEWGLGFGRKKPRVLQCATFLHENCIFQKMIVWWLVGCSDCQSNGN